MRKFIATYFYEDIEEQGAYYGNIALPLASRNEVYWRTVYCFFYTSIAVNGTDNFKYIFFTNNPDFKYRDKLEAMGVEVITGLVITNRSASRWATVKFFFDVLSFVVRSDCFVDTDSFIFLDTDVVCVNEVSFIFDEINSNELPLVYEFQELNKSAYFHDMLISAGEEIYFTKFKKSILVNAFVGGEFFGASKRTIRRFLPEFLLLSSDSRFSTEEQVLTLVHAEYRFITLSNSIYRVWTTLRLIDIPSNWKSFCFLHLPSEKQFGLSVLFDETAFMDSEISNRQRIIDFVSNKIIFDGGIILYCTLLFRRFRSVFKRLI